MKQRHSRTRFLPIAALAFAAQVFAHGNQMHDLATRSPAASDPVVTLSGYVTDLFVENRVTGTTTRYPVLVADDGQRFVLKDPAAAALIAGSGVTVSGRARNDSIFVTSARTNVFHDNRFDEQRRPTRTYSGTLELAHWDNFDGAPSGYLYSVVGANESVNLRLGTALPDLVRGSQVTVTGQPEADQFVFTDRIVIMAPPPDAKARLAPKLGPFTNQVLVIPVKFPNNATPPYTYDADPFTIASIDNSVFSGAGSAANFYKEGSFNQQMLAGIVAHDGANGFLRSTSPPPTPVGCDYLWIETQAKAAAQARGYTLGSYNNLVYVFPSVGFNCGWSGLAYVGLGRAWVKNTTSVLVFGHELGHNFGLYHAGSVDCGTQVLGGTCTVSDYGDPFGIMGNSRAMHFSAAQKADLQWIAPSTVKTHTAGTATYTLTPLETPGGTNYAVKVPVAANRTYWIEYRQPIGFDAGLASFPNNGAQLRVASPFEYNCSSCADDTQFLDMVPSTSTFTDGALVEGQGYTDPLYGLRVDVLAATPSALTLSVASPGAATAASLPAGFAGSQFGGSGANVASPTAMAFAPDGRLFVAQQGGSLRVFKNGALLPTPFVNLTVDSSGERGLLGVALDPNFAVNQFVYVHYTTPGPPIHNRISRFTASGDVALAGSEAILMDLETLSATNHNGGALHFGIDGKLYVAVGDNAVGSNAQSLGNRLGKLLRINPDGTIPTDNPFYSQATGNNRAIWTLGLRNPFTFGVQPGTGRIFINDVGQSAWEEIDEGIAGRNFGWPTCEGRCAPPNPAFTDPIYQYTNDSVTCAISGGAFYNPAARMLPAEYLGKYFFADLCANWISYLDPTFPNMVSALATGLSSPVDLQVGPDGALYYLQRGGGGQVWRVAFDSYAMVRGRNDFDGDGRTDYAVWRPVNGTWYVIRSSDGQMVTRQWGLPGDIPVPGDYDHDGKTDFAVWRPANGAWYVIRSSDGQMVTRQWGLPGDVPVPGDYDGDGVTDFAVWRPASGIWYVVRSSDGQVVARQWGLPGDVPVPADYDNDAKTDYAVWRPANGVWYVVRSFDGQSMVRQWGLPGDVPVPGDYDGDTRTDYAVWRPANGVWYVIQSSDDQASLRQWGLPGDVPVPGDYDGDGKTNFAVWRPGNGVWYVIPGGGGITTRQWGLLGDVPVPGR